MFLYIVKRVTSSVVVLWAVITITFLLMHAIPGGPFTEEKKLPPPVLANIEERYHLHDPLLTQYTDYVKHAAVLDLGPSFKYPGQTVNDIIAQSMPVSGQLGLISLFLALAVGIPAGLVAAWKKNSFVDYGLMVGATLGVSVPSFIAAALLIQLFAFTWPILPAAMWKGPLYVIMPAIALAIQPMAFIMRLTRSSVMDALSQDYIRTARSRGIPMGRTLVHHALRNALLPVISYIGPLAAALLTGSFIVETLFAIPGLGRYFVTSIYNRDYTVIMGITIFYSVLVISLNLLIDLLYPLLDPRIRLHEEEKEG